MLTTEQDISGTLPMVMEERKKSYTIRATSCLKRMAQDIIELSQIAHEYHQEFGYQEYIEWVKEDLKLSKSYGCNLLNVYENYGVSPTVGVDQFPIRTLFLLSAPSTPDSAREEALELAETGESVTHKIAKEITDEHKKIEELTAKLAEKEAQLKRSCNTNGMLLEKLSEKSAPAPSSEPPVYLLIPEILHLVNDNMIMPAKAKALKAMPEEGQRVWYSDYVQKFSLENQLIEKEAALQKIQAQALKAIEEKEDALKQLKSIDGTENAELIAKYEAQIKTMKAEYNREKEEFKAQTEERARELYARTNKERIEKAEKEKALAEKREKEAREKASAAWKHNDELTRENKKLQSQLEVDKPTNIDNARALKLSSELKHLEWTFPDIRSEAELAGGEMHETKKVILEIINRWSSLLQELDGQEIIEVN